MEAVGMTHIEPSDPSQRSLYHRLGLVEAEVAVIEHKANARIDRAGSLVRALVELAGVCGVFMKCSRLPRLPTEAIVADWRALSEAAYKAQERIEPFLVEHGLAHADPDQLRSLHDFFAWVPERLSALEASYAEVHAATETFIDKHQLKSVIESAKAEVMKVFGDRGISTVELEIDPESGGQFLYVVAETKLDLDEAQPLSDQLDAWWIEQVPPGTPLSVMVRHV